MDLDEARAAYLAAAERADIATTNAKVARGTAGYPAAITLLHEAQQAQVGAHRQLRAATTGHHVDPAVLARLDQDGAALDTQLAAVRAELQRLG